MAQQFRLVKYYNLLRYIYIYIWLVVTGIWILWLSIVYGMSSFPLTFRFFREVETTNQVNIPIKSHEVPLNPIKPQLFNPFNILKSHIISSYLLVDARIVHQLIRSHPKPLAVSKLRFLVVMNYILNHVNICLPTLNVYMIPYSIWNLMMKL